MNAFQHGLKLEYGGPHNPPNKGIKSYRTGHTHRMMPGGVMGQPKVAEYAQPKRRIRKGTE